MRSTGAGGVGSSVNEREILREAWSMHAFSRWPATLRGVTTSDTNIAVFGHTRGCDPPHDARLRQDLHRASRRGSERGGERASEQEKEGEGKCV
jgi:hypothetical protein